MFGSPFLLCESFHQHHQQSITDRRGMVAAAMAMPNLMPSSPGKTVVGAGVANYKGYNAFAAGATYRSENSKWLVNGAVSVTPNGDAGVRAQAGYEF